MNWVYKIGIIAFLTLAGLKMTYGQLNQVDKNGKKQGEWVKYYEERGFTDVIRYKGQFKNDFPVGEFIYYYPSKKVRAIIEHNEDHINSRGKYYFENGKIASTGNFKNEKKEGVWLNYTLEGNLSSQETFKDGELDGLKTTFYRSDVVPEGRQNLILRKDNYKNGRLDGESIEYFSDGIVRAKGNYKNGVKEGVFIIYHPNGKKMIEERWKYRTKHGWWFTYDESGKELGRKYYNHGVELEGEQLEKHLKDLKEKGINPNN